MIGPFPSYKLNSSYFFKSCIKQIFVHQVFLSLLVYTVKLVKSCKLNHTNRLMQDRFKGDLQTFLEETVTLYYPQIPNKEGRSATLLKTESNKVFFL